MIGVVIGIREYRGFWWLPNDDSRRLAGTLTVDNGSGALDLVGHFGHRLLSETGTERTYSLELAEQQRIVGLGAGGEQLTLEKNRASNYTENLPGIAVAAYKCDVALIGKHFKESEIIAFDEIAIRATDLTSWTQISGFHITNRLETHERGYATFAGVEISYEVPDNIDITLARGERAFIRFRASGDGIGARTDQVALTEDALFHFRFTKPADLERVFERVGQFRNFLSLAVARPVAILSVTGYQDDYVTGRFDTAVPVEILWGIPHNPSPPARPRHPLEMLFTLADTTPDVSKVMRSWLSKQDRLKPVFNLFFGMRYHTDMYLDVTFLSYAQAIETYDFRRRRKPSRRTLAQRMGDVLDQCRTVSRKIVGANTGDRELFIEGFKVSRNYYTHYNPKLEEKAARGIRLLLLTIQLQAIIEMSLLCELGFGVRAIDDIFERVGRYGQIERLKSSSHDQRAEVCTSS